MVDLVRGARNQFADLLAARLESRRRAFVVKRAKDHAEEMRSKDKSASEIATALSPVMGCPCCGPPWWRDLVIEAHAEEGLPLPPELVGVQ